MRSWGSGPWSWRTPSGGECWCSPTAKTGRARASCAGGSTTTRRAWFAAGRRAPPMPTAPGRTPPRSCRSPTSATPPSATPTPRPWSSATSGRCSPRCCSGHGRRRTECLPSASSSSAGRGSCARTWPRARCWSSPSTPRLGSCGRARGCSSSAWAARRWHCGSGTRCPPPSSTRWTSPPASSPPPPASASAQEVATALRLHTFTSATAGRSWRASRTAASTPWSSTRSTRTRRCPAAFARGTSSTSRAGSWRQAVRCR
mmetsp:Transcript_96724/g.270741  ORF Transcript_96724/g.270741 Transcript_96724/m.270741 type:complete len:259 (+) Transcript_96724:130-906(+)